MKRLLDTHALLWSATASARLKPQARIALEDGLPKVWQPEIPRLSHRLTFGTGRVVDAHQ